jgi:hypothetical protein
MIQDDDAQIANLKFLLMCFEDMSGLKINYHKSEVVVMGASELRKQQVADWLNCKRGAFPFIYLGLPISDRKLTMEQWLFLVRKLAGRVEPWWGKFMSSGGRLTGCSCYRMGFALNLTRTGPGFIGKDLAPRGAITLSTGRQSAGLRNVEGWGSLIPKR